MEIDYIFILLTAPPRLLDLEQQPAAPLLPLCQLNKHENADSDSAQVTAILGLAGHPYRASKSLCMIVFAIF